MRWVRPIISFIFAVGILYGFYIGKIDADKFLLIATLAVGYWFYKRDQEKKGDLK